MKIEYPPRDCPRECLFGYRDGCPGGCRLERLPPDDPPPFSESSTIPEMIGGAIIGSVWGLLVAGVVAAGVVVGIGILALLILTLGS